MLEKKTKDLLVNTIAEKTEVKNQALKNTVEAMKMLKGVLENITKEYNVRLEPNNIKLEFKDRGAYESEIHVSEDVLVFSMYSHAFEFNSDHHIWKNSYVKTNKFSSYCGIINIYNFLSDSFKYNRSDDQGYLIARIFINKDKHYFVEGKRQLGFLYNDFGNKTICEKDLNEIIHSAILYSLEFDLLVPHYDHVKVISVADINEKIHNSKIKTGKRLGFNFTSDDVLEDTK